MTYITLQGHGDAVGGLHPCDVDRDHLPADALSGLRLGLRIFLLHGDVQGQLILGEVKKYKSGHICNHFFCKLSMQIFPPPSRSDSTCSCLSCSFPTASFAYLLALVLCNIFINNVSNNNNHCTKNTLLTKTDKNLI